MRVDEFESRIADIRKKHPNLDIEAFEIDVLVHQLRFAEMAHQRIKGDADDVVAYPGDSRIVIKADRVD